MKCVEWLVKTFLFSTLPDSPWNLHWEVRCQICDNAVHQLKFHTIVPQSAHCEAQGHWAQQHRVWTNSGLLDRQTPGSGNMHYLILHNKCQQWHSSGLCAQHTPYCSRSSIPSSNFRKTGGSRVEATLPSLSTSRQAALSSCLFTWMSRTHHY